MLCTAMVLIVMSVMGGFLDQLKRKARSMLGDVIVQNQDPLGFPLYQEFIDDISTWPEIERATPVIYTLGLLRFVETTRRNSVKVVGIRLADVYVVNDFQRSLYYEKHYPGTTTLGPQTQPLIAPDLNAPRVELRQPNGQVDSILRPVLPPAHQAAFERAWQAGVRDTETPDSEMTEFFRELGLPPAPGVYAFEEGRVAAGLELPGVILGRDLLCRRESDGRYRRFADYPRGMGVQLTLVPLHQDASADTPIRPLLRYVDDSRTGIYEIDSQHVYLDFDYVQKLLLMAETKRPKNYRAAGAVGDAAWDEAAPAADAPSGEVADGSSAAPPSKAELEQLAAATSQPSERAKYERTAPARCSQIQIKIRPEKLPARTTIKDLTARLGRHYSDLLDDERARGLSFEERAMVRTVRVYTWEESQMHIIAPVERERELVTTLFAIISIVAAVLVMCILYMIVLQRTRDIGILKSIGGSSAGAALIFIAYGFAIGVVGGALGVTLGYWFVRRINDVQEFLARFFGFRVWDRAVYSFDEIPNTVRGDDMFNVFIAGIVFATAGSFVAAWRAGSMQPVEALRDE